MQRRTYSDEPSSASASSDFVARGLNNRGGNPGRLTPTADHGAGADAFERPRTVRLLSAHGGSVGGGDRPGLAEGGPAAEPWGEPSAAPFAGPNGVGRAQRARNLDTLQTSLGDCGERLQSEVSSFPGLAPAGQVVLLPSEPAQLALDGTPMAPAAPAPIAGTLENPLPAPGPELPRAASSWERNQLAFDFATERELDQHGRLRVLGVQMSFDEWKDRTADALAWHGMPDHAERLRDCGSFIVVPQCKDCGAWDMAKRERSANCEARVCPSCARKTAQERRGRLRRAMTRWPWQRHGKSWFMHTMTCKRPKGTNVARLQADFESVTALRLAVWHKLKAWGCTYAAAHVEVSPGGMVHVHMLAYHRFVRPHELAELRQLAVSRCASPHYNIRRANKKSCAEVAKYVCKGVAHNGASARQTHPMLAAMVQVAFASRRDWQEYGAWKEIPDDEAPVAWVCPCCQGLEQRRCYMTGRQFTQLQREEKRRERPPP